MLRHEPDAQDAFQAVFLVLARKAATIRSRDSVASWLYGVTLRVCAVARTAAFRRRRHEQQAAAGRDEAVEQEFGNDWATVLHDEIARLPGRYREPVVLCHLEGLSCEETATRLNCPVGTVKSRLARGRQRLRVRLERRGLAPAVGLLGAVVGAEAAAAVPTALIQSTSRIAVLCAAVPGVVSPTVVALANEGGKFLTLKTAVAALMVGALTLAVPAVLVLAGPRQEKTAGGRVGASVDQNRPETDSQQTVNELVAFIERTRFTEQPEWESKPYLLLRLGALQAALGDKDAAARTLERASIAVASLEPAFERAGVLARIGRAQARLGSQKSARATLQRAMTEVAEIAEMSRKAMALSNLASAQAILDDREGVTSTLQSLREVIRKAPVNERADALRHLAYAMARAGDFDGAVRLVLRPPPDIPANRDPGRLLGQLAYVAFAARSDLGTAGAEGLERLSELAKSNREIPRGIGAEIALAQAHRGGIDEALRTVEDFRLEEAERARVLPHIADAQVRAGDKEAAVRTLHQALNMNATLPPEIRVWIAETLIGAGDLEGALQVATILDHDRYAARAVEILSHIARALRGSGKEEEARQIVDKARAFAERRSPDADTLEVVRMKAALGHYEDARQLAETIDNPLQQGEANATIAEAQARVGEVHAALNWIATLNSPRARASALHGLSRGLAEKASVAWEVDQALMP